MEVWLGLVVGCDEYPSSVSGALEGGEVEGFAEDLLVDMMHVGKGELGGQQCEGNGGVFELGLEAGMCHGDDLLVVKG